MSDRFGYVVFIGLLLQFLKIISKRYIVVYHNYEIKRLKNEHNRFIKDRSIDYEISDSN